MRLVASRVGLCLLGCLLSGLTTPGALAQEFRHPAFVFHYEDAHRFLW